MISQRILLWVLLTFSIISISSAGAIFQLMDDVPPLLRASWRFQLTALLMAPIFFLQYRDMRQDSVLMDKLRLPETRSILLGSGIGIRVPFPIVGVLRFDFGLGIIDNKIKSNSFHFGIGQKF